MGAARLPGQFTSCLLLMAPNKPDAAIEAAVVYAGVRAGVGEGAVWADLDSLTGLAKAVGPVVFTAAYVAGQRTGAPGLAWSVAAAAAHVAAQLLAHGPLSRRRD